MIHPENRTLPDPTFARMEAVDMSVGDLTILDHVDLDIRRGELMAVVGVNGAGKSSLLRCLGGMWVPSAGSITIDGLDRQRDDLVIRRFTAYLGSDPEPVGKTIRTSLQIIAEAYGLEKERYCRRQDVLLRLFDLKEIQDLAPSSISKGQKKKACVASAILTGARFLILDEPFTGGIDPKGYDALRRILLALRDDREVTVVFATQILELAVTLADRIAVVSRGRLISVGTMEELRKESGAKEGADLHGIFARFGSGEPEPLIEELVDEMGGVQ